MEIRHFSHDHPLIPQHKATDLKRYHGICKVCKARMSRRTPSYVCVGCDYYLHENCARLEREIQHPDHPDHPLFLTRNPYEPQPFTCKGCSQRDYGFSYHCSECRFDLDVECALDSLTTPTIAFQHQGHELVLSYTPSARSWKCLVCPAILEPPLFKCKDRCCLYRIHLHCAPLTYPETTRNKHLHPLVYRKECFVEDESGEYYCDACEERRHPDLPVYYCVQCRSASAPYTAHITCGLSHQVLQSLAKERESSERVKIHPLHRHHLILTDHNYKSTQKCIVCKSALDNGRALVCEQCGFGLHYDCRELEIPTEVRHPIHSQHSLTLHVDATYVGPFFQCSACKDICLCFIYRCNCCDFNLCARCSKYVQTTPMFNYQNHQLFLFCCGIGSKCDFCGRNGASPRFVCMEPGCTYNLHFLCAPFSLPETIEIKDHEHSLNLANDSTANVSCICGKSPYDDDRLYCCNQCSKKVHTACALFEKLPALIAKFNNSTREHKVTRLIAELERLQMDEIEMNTQLMEIHRQLKDKSRSIKETEKAISQLVDLPNASSE